MLLKEYLKLHRVVTDGSMGTYYSILTVQSNAISEYASLTDPDTIMGIHKAYIDAGAGMLRTNTFAANRATLKITDEEQKKLLHSACRLAKRAVEDTNQEENASRQIHILGDIGPIPQNAESKEDEVYEEYRMMCDIFLEEGLSGVQFETFSNINYIEKLAGYLKAKKSDFFIAASFSVNKNGYTASGIRAERILKQVSELKEIDACGLNCGIGSGHMYRLLKSICLPANKFIIAAPNAGYPEQMQNRMVFMDNAEYFADNVKNIADLGIEILGGCCGTTPAYISRLSSVINDKEPVRLRKSTEPGSVTIKEPLKENSFMQRFKEGKKVIAVELDPPYDADIDKLMECAHALKISGADLITFADSPMGRSRVDSILMSIKIAEETGLSVMPHICCRDRNMISMRSTLLGAYIHGIRNLLLVTGDPVPSDNRTAMTGVFDYNSIQLMDFAKEMNLEHFIRDPFVYGGALNYGRGSIDKVVERIRRKIEAGASYFLTQPIFTREDAEKIIRIKEKVDTKILCGIMPFVSHRNASFIKNEFTGINVPEDIVNRYRPDMSKEEAEMIGAMIAREMMELLEPVADGYYFMLPFNRVSLMDKILK